MRSSRYVSEAIRRSPDATFAAASDRTGRRGLLLSSAAAALLAVLPPAALAAADVPPAQINLSLAPDQRKYDPADPELRAAANLLQKALNAETVQVILLQHWP